MKITKEELRNLIKEALEKGEITPGDPSYSETIEKVYREHENNIMNTVREIAGRELSLEEETEIRRVVENMMEDLEYEVSVEFKSEWGWTGPE